VKSYFTSSFALNLSKRALNRLTRNRKQSQAAMATPAECLHNLPFTFSCQKKLPSVKYQGHTDHCDMTFDLVNPIYGSFFFNKVAKTRNSLPNRVLSANTTNTFKTRLNILWHNQYIICNFRIQSTLGRHR